MPEASLSASVNYTAPGGSVVNQTFVAVGSYAASSLGTVDVPSGAGAGASFAIPLGGVANAIGFALKNSVGTGVRVKFQGNPTGMWLANSGCILYGNASGPVASSPPVGAIEVNLINAQTAPGEISYLIFGD